MSKIILDFGSGNSCRNDKAIIKRMYDELKVVDTGKYEVIIKWQLFEDWYGNTPLTHEAFDYAYQYGTSLGYKVTASVFDKPSLDFLLQYDVPFIKIANRRELDWMIGEIPRKTLVYVSYGNEKDLNKAPRDIRPLICASKYPATIEQYEAIFTTGQAFRLVAISDHTTNFGLWYRYQPQIIEWHYKLKDSVGLDAGEFARTPEQLAEIL